jgi:hypothetical protein
MPNTSIAEIFFEWARAQSWNARELAKIREALHAFGVDSDDLESFELVINSEEFKSWQSDKFGLHWPQSNYAPVSSRLTPATTVGLAVHYGRQSGHLKASADPFKVHP